MSLEIANLTTSRPSRPLIQRAADCVLAFVRRQGEVSVVIVNDQAMRRLNRRYRGIDKTTDVLSFAEADSETPAPGVIGELVISYEQIKRQAKEFGHPLGWELAYIIIHGMLHLVGYEDETEAGRREMERLGNRLIKKMNI